MKKSYADTCLERANAATPGPWKNDCGNGQIETQEWRVIVVNRCGNYERNLDVIGMFPDYTPETYPEIAELLKHDNEDDMEFIAYSRTDVPELARRLKEACRVLRDKYYTAIEREAIADELERMPGEKI